MSIAKIIKELQEFDLKNDKYIVVGVSAGPDSMALLHILEKSISCQIVCAHINHNVRAQSQEEEEYLKEYCQKHNIIFECYKIKNYKENNFENEARKKRYAFYEQILNKYNCHNLFLAHHGDDLIETILMKIVRGSNIEGYAGIKKISYLENYKIVRPLISITKNDIINYNKENNIKYYIDNTNNDIKYTRNRYRKCIIPLLKEEDKNVHLKFLKYSNMLQEYDNYIRDEIKRKINSIYNNNTINIETINNEHPFMKKNICFYILSLIYNNQGNIIREKNINDIIKMTNSKKANYKINLPKNIIAIKEYNKIIFKSNDISQIPKYKIEIKDSIEIENFIIKQTKYTTDDSNNTCRLYSKDIALPLYIRNVQKGDYMEILGLNGKKKIKDIFINSKINPELRKKYPLLVDSKNQILWIPGIKKSKYNRKNNEIYDIILTSTKKEKENEEKK